MNLGFTLFEILFMPIDNRFGIWFFSLENCDLINRNLFSIYYCDGHLLIDILFMRFIFYI